MSRLLVGGLMACVISGVAFAQAVPAMPKEYQEMAAAMAAAQAKAVRPGDEALGCAAIDKELTQLQPVAPGRGASSQQAAAIQQAMVAQRNMTPQQVQAMQQALAAQGMTPQQIQAMQTLALQQAQPLSTPQAQAALRAQALAAQQALDNPQVQAALAAQNAQLAQLQDPSAQLAMMTTVMPQLLRSQRLIGLAMAKGCTSLGAPPVVPAKK